MTAVLFRHEFLRTRSALAIALAAALAAAGVAALLRVSGISLLTGLGLLLGSVVGPGLVVAVDALLAVDYWRTGYGREGYFTHTLPVAGRRIFAVRLGYGLLVVGLATLLGSLLTIGVLSVGPGSEATFDPLREGLSRHPGLAVLLVLGVVASSWLYLVQLYFAASIGSEGRLGGLGVGGPVLVWFAVYLVMQLLSGIALFALPWGLRLVDGGLTLQRYTLAMRSGSQDIGLPIGVVVVGLALLVALVARTSYSWQHKVSLR